MYEQDSITGRPAAAYHHMPDEAYQTPRAAAPLHRGRFQPGPDARRHVFSKDECSRGFWAAVESIITRHPDAIMPDGRHMVCNFLRTRQERRAA